MTILFLSTGERTVAATVAVGRFVRNRIFRRPRVRNQNRDQVPLQERQKRFTKQKSDTVRRGSTRNTWYRKRKKVDRSKGRAQCPAELDDDTTAEPNSLTERSDGTQRSKTLSSTPFSIDSPSIVSIDAEEEYNPYGPSTSHKHQQSLLRSSQSSTDNDQKSITASTSKLFSLHCLSMHSLPTIHLEPSSPIILLDKCKSKKTSGFLTVSQSPATRRTSGNVNRTEKSTSMPLLNFENTNIIDRISGIVLSDESSSYNISNTAAISSTSVSSPVPQSSTQETDASREDAVEIHPDILLIPGEDKIQKDMYPDVSPGDYIYTSVSPPLSESIDYYRNLLVKGADAFVCEEQPGPIASSSKLPDISPGDLIHKSTSPPLCENINYYRNVLVKEADALSRGDQPGAVACSSRNQASAVPGTSSTESSTRDQVVLSTTSSSSRDQVVPRESSRNRKPKITKSQLDKKNMRKKDRSS